MNCWRPLVLSVLTAALLAGCVYGPPYYYDTPFSPSPYFLPSPMEPPPPYPPGAYYHRYRSEPNFHRRRYFDDRGTPYAGPAEGPPEYRPSTEEPAPVPPSKREIPEAPKGSQPQTDTKNAPTATKGSKPGRVKVPFPPYTELDVSGMTPGSLAKDPSTGKVFRIPQ